MSQGSEVKTRAQRAYLRLAISSIAFFIFLAVHLNLIFLNQGGYSVLYSLTPLIIALLLLPRRVRGGTVDFNDPEQNTLVLRLSKLQQWSSWARFVFLITAVIVVMVLPRIIPIPQ